MGGSIFEKVVRKGARCEKRAQNRPRCDCATKAAEPGAPLALTALSLRNKGSLLAEAGCGADIVSRGELRRALTAGIAPEKIVYSGVGKRRDEIREALEVGHSLVHKGASVLK